jgi:hypothetical protein
MFKRALLGLAFVAALGAGSLGFSSKAAAWHCDDGYGYGAYYGNYYPSYYGYGYGPRVVSYRNYPTYPVYYGGFRDGHRHHHHHDDDRGRVFVSFGF